MTGGPSKTNANTEWAAGQVKSAVGGLVGNEQMKAEGDAKIAKGNAEHKAAQDKQYAEGAGDRVKGTVKDKVGGLLGNEQMQAEGKAKDTKGNLKMDANS